MFFVILAMVLTVSVTAGHKPPPVTVVAATALEAAKSASLEKLSGAKITVLVDPNLAPVVPVVSSRNTNVFEYQQKETNRYAFDSEGKRVIVNGRNEILPTITNSSIASIIPGGTGDNWYKAPAQDAPYSKDAEMAARQAQQSAYSAPASSTYYSSGYTPSYPSSYIGSSYGSAGYTEKVRFHPWGTTYSYRGTPSYTSYGSYGGYGGNYGDGRYYGPYSVYTTTTRDYGLAVGAVGTTYRY